MFTHPLNRRRVNTDLDRTTGHGTKMSPRSHNVPLAESQLHVINPANPRRALDDRVEDRLHVGGRAADDAEHLGRRRLMLQRLAQLRVTLLDFFEQPHIFDRYDRLCSEGLEQGYLLFGKWPDFDSSEQNRSD